MRICIISENENERTFLKNVLALAQTKSEIVVDEIGSIQEPTSKNLPDVTILNLKITPSDGLSMESEIKNQLLMVSDIDAIKLKPCILLLSCPPELLSHALFEFHQKFQKERNTLINFFGNASLDIVARLITNTKSPILKYSGGNLSILNKPYFSLPDWPQKITFEEFQKSLPQRYNMLFISEFINELLYCLRAIDANLE